MYKKIYVSVVISSKIDLEFENTCLVEAGVAVVVNVTVAWGAVAVLAWIDLATCKERVENNS